VWGNNANGQVGNGINANTSVPSAVPGLTNIVAIAGGGAHTVALSITNQFYAFGDNFFGQIGNRSGNYSPQGSRLNILRGDVDISDATVSAGTSLGLQSTTGQIYFSTGKLTSSLEFSSQTTRTRTIAISNDSFTDAIADLSIATTGPYVVGATTCDPVNGIPSLGHGTTQSPNPCNVTLTYAPTSSGSQNGEFRASWSGAVQITLDLQARAPTTIAVTASPGGGTAVGAPVTLTATVSGGANLGG
jgi:hypothetical protein